MRERGGKESEKERERERKNEIERERIRCNAHDIRNERRWNLYKKHTGYKAKRNHSIAQSTVPIKI